MSVTTARRDYVDIFAPPVLSRDGRYLAFIGADVRGSTVGFSNVYVRDRLAGRTTFESVGGNGSGLSLRSDGRFLHYSGSSQSLLKAAERC